jgi:hypothetical protein
VKGISAAGWATPADRVNTAPNRAIRVVRMGRE